MKYAQRALLAIVVVVLSSIFLFAAPLGAASSGSRGWTQVTEHEDVDILACRKGENLRAGFKLLAYRHRFAIRKININVIHSGASHWLGKYEAWGEIRHYSYNSSVPDRHVTLMVKKRNGDNRLFSGFVYNEIKYCE